ncbi:hypothetical protein [Paenibacillus apiarius]|uniref:hypothetical protein n=1 Tax=Paenibacillus apiarius TaxID=46240 RepID=UPI001980C13F|nr:hypothetical protein [Paenibacillus apiarius]MBN3524990.1 hypothetical protein [Paenibacillus apiarius]
MVNLDAHIKHLENLQDQGKDIQGFAQNLDELKQSLIELNHTLKGIETLRQKIENLARETS